MRNPNPTQALPWWVGLVALALMSLLLHPIWRNAAPVDEEWAITAASHWSRWSEWFTRGYTDYFLSYLGWPPYPTFRLRPLANAVYALVNTLGGGQRVLLFLAYAMHVLCVGLLARLITRYTDLTRPWRWLSLVIAGLSPALLQIPVGYRIAPPLQYPIYGVEMACAALCLLSVDALLQGALWRYLFLALCAVFTKETALTLPLTALLCAGLWWHPAAPRRNAAAAGLILAPLVAWLVVRLLVFQPKGVDAGLHGSHLGAIVATIAKSALVWPTTLFRAYPGDIVSRLHTSGLRAAAPELLGIGLNLLVWVIGLSVVVRVLHQARAWRFSAWIDLTSRPAMALLIIAVGNLALVLWLGGLELRYGYLWTLLGPAMLFHWTGAHRGRRLVPVGMAYVALIGFGLDDLRLNLSAPAIDARADMLAAAAQLTGIARHPPPGTSQLVLAADWTIESASLDSFARVAESPVPIQRISDVMINDHRDCTLEESRQASITLTRTPTRVRVNMTPPPCFDFFFHGGKIPLPPDADPQTELARGDIVYRFPNLQRGTPDRFTGLPNFDLGGPREASIPYDPDALWVLFDFNTRRYRTLAAREIPVEPST